MLMHLFFVDVFVGCDFFFLGMFSFEGNGSKGQLV